ncbi:RbsD/FucU family protein [Eubacterium barkeri]|uniref:L-fucose mutarotase n=1 Tax=Eubacterium barkeri TaxID=1528 RepID=A0A1H3JLD2_EUBBA|nr:RbsD/FucU domain-containing protein [Eubacterium barkeri]SDY40726.1 L-fucose mutarotase [Eubacterium barkeri]
MLKNIPTILSPELLKVMCEMGHGDYLILADGNFPAESMGKSGSVIRYDGVNIPILLDAILDYFPLDFSVLHPVCLMDVVSCETVEPPIWDIYKDIIAKHDLRGPKLIEKIERFEFYEAAKKAYAIIATGEPAPYGNILLQKGVVK